MKNCAFTIVAKNYLGLALILKKSFQKYNDISFYIFLADELDSNATISDINADDTILTAKDCLDIDRDTWEEMAFKYDLTEFCTSIKPSCFKYLIEKCGIEKILYFDPDILFFNSISEILDILNDFEMILTPHLSRCHIKYDGEIKENQFLGSGIFNLGFCGLKNTENILQILDWWEIRLRDMCFADPFEYIFTDQQWMNMIPCFLGEKLYILRELGYNLAPWNFFEREIVVKDSKYMVKERNSSLKNVFPLCFAHYSGYDYQELLNGIVNQKNISDISEYSDINMILNDYMQALKESEAIFSKYINLNYTYNYFGKKNVIITKFQRKLYNGLLRNGIHINNPFSTLNNSFYKILVNKKIVPKKLDTDKLTLSNYQGIDKKMAIIHTIMRFIYKIIGYDQYVLIVKAMRVYARMENHIFLIKKFK